MIPYDPSSYPAPLAALWDAKHIPELGPGRPNDSVKAALQSLDIRALFPKTRDREAASGCLSGLWLYHDFLDESHAISQDLSGWIGSYWHGIMHRREPDASNAKYWFRRVEPNPVYDAMTECAAKLILGVDDAKWDPFAFVDRCEEVRGTRSNMEATRRLVQLMEMRLLFDWCYRQATGQ